MMMMMMLVQTVDEAVVGGPRAGAKNHPERSALAAFDHFDDTKLHTVTHAHLLRTPQTTETVLHQTLLTHFSC